MADEEIKGAVVKLALEDSAFKQGMDDLKKQVKIIDTSFSASVAGVKDWGSTLDGLKSNADSLGQKITVQKQIVQAYTEQMAKSKETLKSNEATMSSLKTKLDAARTAYEQSKASVGAHDEATKKLKVDVDDLTSKFKSSESAVIRAKSSMDGYQIQVNQTTGKLNEMQSELTDTNGKIENFGKEAENAGDKSAEFGSKSGGAIDTLSSALAAAGIAVAFSKIKEAITEATEAAATFEVGIAKIATIADTSSVSMDGIKSAITSLSNETGKSTADLAEATYQAISAGVDTAKSVEFVSNAVKLSEGGFTSATMAVDVLTTAINAYGLSASDATAISDMLVTTQNLGKTTVDKLAGSLGTVIPIAAGLGVNIENLSAAYAVLTKNGVSTDEAGTYVRAMLNALSDTASDVSKTLTKETGKSFAELTESGYSLGDVLKVLNDSVGGDGTAFKNLWGEIRAGTGALSIMNSGAENFNNVLSAMQNSAGATEKAYKTMEATSEHAQAKMTAAAKNFQAAVGDQLLPTLAEIEESGAGAFDWAADFVKANPAVVSTVSALIAVIGTLTAAIVGYAAVTKAAAFVTDVFNKALDANPGFLIASAIAAVTAAIATYVITMPKATDETKEYVDSLKEANKASQETIDSINTQSQNTASMVGALNELTAKEEKTATDKQTILSLVDQLNEAVPNLNLAYDQQTDSLNMTAQAMEAMAQAQADQQLQQQYISELTDKYTAQQDIALRLTQATDDLASAKATLAGYEKEGAAASKIYGDQYEAAKKAVNDATKSIDDLVQAQEDNSNEIDDLNGKIKLYDKSTQNSENANSDQTKTTEELTNSLNEQTTAEKTLTSAMDTASSAFAEQSENGTLSLQTINSLIDAGYAAALSVDSETGAVTLNKDIYIALTKAKLEAQKADLALLETNIQDKMIADGKAALSEAGAFILTAKAKDLASDSDYANLQATKAQEAAISALEKQLSKATVTTHSYSKTTSSSARSAASAAKEAANKVKKAAEEAQKASEKAYSELFDDLKKKFDSGVIDLKTFIQQSETARDKYLKKNTSAWKTSYDDMFDAISDTEKKRLQDIKDNYDSALSDIQGKIDDMQKNLLDVGDITETVTVNDKDITKLSNLDDQTASITAFGDALQALKERGIDSSMLSEIAQMDVGEGTQTANLLLGLSDGDWAKEMTAWDTKQKAAKLIAESYYADDAKTLKDKLTTAVTDLQKDMTTAGLNLGGNITDGLVKGIEDGTINVTAAAAAMMEKAIAAAKKTAGIASPSKVMRYEVGKQIAAGTAKGIEDGTDGVSGSMSVMMDDIIRQAKSLRVQAAGAIQTLTGQVASSPSAKSASASNDSLLAGIDSMLTGAVNAMSSVSSSRGGTYRIEIPISFNGREVSRLIVPDLRSVMKSNPEVVNDF